MKIIPHVFTTRRVFFGLRIVVNEIKLNDRANYNYNMALRMSPTDKRDKERLRQSKVRVEEQDRIIRIIKGIKK